MEAENPWIYRFFTEKEEARKTLPPGEASDCQSARFPERIVGASLARPPKNVVFRIFRLAAVDFV